MAASKNVGIIDGIFKAAHQFDSYVGERKSNFTNWFLLVIYRTSFHGIIILFFTGGHHLVGEKGSF